MVNPIVLLVSLAIAGYSAFSKVRVERDPEFDDIEIEINRWLGEPEIAIPFNADSDVLIPPKTQKVGYVPLTAVASGVFGQGITVAGGE